MWVGVSFLFLFVLQLFFLASRSCLQKNLCLIIIILLYTAILWLLSRFFHGLFILFGLLSLVNILLSIRLYVLDLLNIHFFILFHLRLAITLLGYR